MELNNIDNWATTTSNAISTSIDSKTHSNSGKQSLGHIGNDDADKKDDSIKPVIAKYERDDEERDSEGDCDSGDDVNEVGNLARDRRLADLQATRQVGNTTHHCAIAGVDHQTAGRAYQPTACTGLLHSNTTTSGNPLKDDTVAQNWAKN